ncbi:MAG: hypothetical protein AAGE52_33255 [Myxococcota bacterium]
MPDESESAPKRDPLPARKGILQSWPMQWAAASVALLIALLGCCLTQMYWELGFFDHPLELVAPPDDTDELNHPETPPADQGTTMSN